MLYMSVCLCVTCLYKRYREELRKERAKRLGEPSGSRSSSKSRDSKKMKKKVFLCNPYLRTNMRGEKRESYSVASLLALLFYDYKK